VVAMTGISLMLVVLGPAILAGAMAIAFLRRRGERPSGLGDAEAARIIVAAAVLAAALVTVGILMVRRWL